MFLYACKFSQQADQQQHQLLDGGGRGVVVGVGGESTLIFWA